MPRHRSEFTKSSRLKAISEALNEQMEGLVGEAEFRVKRIKALSREIDKIVEEMDNEK